MRTVIYLDVLLLTNGLIAIVLLGACAVVCSQPCKLWRLVLAGAVAAGTSLLLLAPPIPFWAQLIYQVFTAAMIIKTAFPWKDWRVFFRQAIWYTLMNLLLAGGVSAACAHGASWLETNNLSYYFQISPFLLLGSSLGIYVVLCLVRMQLGTLQSFTELRLVGADWQIQVSGYCDTGLTVVDPLSGKDVVLVYYPVVQKRLPPALAGGLEQMFQSQVPTEMKYKFRVIACDTIGGRVMLPAIPVEIKAGNVQQSVIAAFTMQTPADKRCEALFGAELGRQMQKKTPAHKNNAEVLHETVL